MTVSVDIKKVVEQMTFISIMHMAVPVDIEKIILGDYPDAEKDLCVYLVQGYYNQIIKDAGGKIDAAGREKAFAIAKYHATRRLASNLGDLVERSTMFLLLDAQSTGWHHALEYENIAELLAGILEGKAGSNEAYDWKFIIETLIPAAEQANVPVNTFINASLKVKKLRGLVPASRELIERQKNNLIRDEEVNETLSDWLTKAADPAITYDALFDELNEWKGKSVKRDNPIVGYKIMMPDNKFMLCIPTESDKQMAVIEQALRNRIDFRLTGFDWLSNKVLSMMKVNRLKEVKDD